MAHVACKILWLKYLLTEFGFKLKGPVPMYYDYQSVIYITKNPMFHDDTKHMKGDSHLIRDAVMKKVICAPFILSSEQLIDT